MVILLHVFRPDNNSFLSSHCHSPIHTDLESPSDHGNCHCCPNPVGCSMPQEGWVLQFGSLRVSCLQESWMICLETLGVWVHFMPRNALTSTMSQKHNQFQHSSSWGKSWSLTFTHSTGMPWHSNAPSTGPNSVSQFVGSHSLHKIHQWCNTQNMIGLKYIFLSLYPHVRYLVLESPQNLRNLVIFRNMRNVWVLLFWFCFCLCISGEVLPSSCLFCCNL